MSINLAEEYEQRGGAGKKAKRTRDKINYSKQGNSSSQTFFYTGTPKQVVFKIIKNIDKASNKANRNNGYSCMQLLEYIATDKEELEDKPTVELIDEQLPKHLETDDGRILSTKKEIYDFYKEWEETFTDRKDGKDFEHLIISPEDIDVKDTSKLLDATRQMLRKEFGNDGYNYAFNLHTNTKNPHVHITMRVHNTTKEQRLDIKKDKIWKVKVAAASELKNKGLNYEASVNFEKILGINGKLDYIKSKDLSWYKANVEKLKNTNIDELGNQLQMINSSIDNLIIDRQSSSDKISKTNISNQIKDLYTQKRIIITSINSLEFDLQKATNNYETLVSKRDSIDWYLKGTKAYKTIDTNIKEAQEFIIQKKLEIDKAQAYLSLSKPQMSFSHELKKDTLYYVNEYITNNKENEDLSSLLYQLGKIETKLSKSNLAQEIKELKKELLDDGIIDNYEKLKKAKNKQFLDTPDTKLNIPIEKREIDYINLYDPLNRTSLKEFSEQVTAATKNKDIEKLDLLYTSPEYSNTNVLLKKKFELYAEALDISREDIFNHILENNQDKFPKDWYSQEDKKEDAFNELSESNKFNEFDKYLFYTKSLGTVVEQKYQEKIEDIDKQVNIMVESGELYLSAEQLIIDKKNDNINTKTTHELVSYREITPQDTKVIDFLKQRGLHKIPKNLYIIEGKNSGISQYGKPYTIINKGVGVINGDMSKEINLSSQGADMHLLNPVTLSNGSVLKTVSYGAKDFTLVPGQNEKAVAIFESKMDYVAALQQIDLSDRNVIIANGTGNANKIIDWVNENKIDKVTFFNQYDNAGIKFVDDIIEATNTKEFNYIKYEASEHKTDINDLLIDNVELKTRVKKGNINDFLIDHGEEPKELKNEVPGQIEKIYPVKISTEDKKRIEDIKLEISNLKDELQLKAEAFSEKENTVEVEDFEYRLYEKEEQEIEHKIIDLDMELYNVEPEEYIGDMKLTDIKYEYKHLVPSEIKEYISTLDKESTVDLKEQDLSINDMIDYINNKNEVPGQNINFDKLKEQYDHKVENFTDKVSKAIDNSIKIQKQQNNKEMIISNTGKMASALKRNIMRIENTRATIDTVAQKNTPEHKQLEINLKELVSDAKKLNEDVKVFEKAFDKSELNIKDKISYKLGYFDTLAAHKHSEKLVKVLPELKDDLINRSLEHFKLINKKLLEPKLDKVSKDDLMSKSSQLLKDFNKLKPTWKQERTITKLHSEQVKSLSKQRGLGR
ncbi:MAG: hypothetical protein DRG78_17230 [Epsilonproteobacteria bacterium]|nr:MAG: hypothetical protein DRG78_17230 [Campylobacterota bacterium]